MILFKDDGGIEDGYEGIILPDPGTCVLLATVDGEVRRRPRCIVWVPPLVPVWDS
jgi:hypothetical protein